MEFFEITENRLPPGVSVFAAHTRQHLRLRTLTAAPPAETGRGTVVLLNGRAEFVERYYETITELQARGFHVAAFDWRGQGGSPRASSNRLRGHVRSFREYDEDLRAVMDGVVTKNCPGPYYAIGHSTGGHILLRALSRRSWFKKVVVTCPLMELQYGSWPKGLAFFLAATATAFGFGRAFLPGFDKPPYQLRPFESNPLTSDSRRWERDRRMLQEHPELGVGGPTFAWLVATMLSLKDLHYRRRGRGLNCPVLMVLAGREAVVDNKAAHAFAAQMPGVATVTIAQSLHEVLMENDAVRQEFWAAFDSFIG
jgi:lysophospholipase